MVGCTSSRTLEVESGGRSEVLSGVLEGLLEIADVLEGSVDAVLGLDDGSRLLVLLSVLRSRSGLAWRWSGFSRARWRRYPVWTLLLCLKFSVRGWTIPNRTTRLTFPASACLLACSRFCCCTLLCSSNIRCLRTSSSRSFCSNCFCHRSSSSLFSASARSCSTLSSCRRRFIASRYALSRGPS